VKKLLIIILSIFILISLCSCASQQEIEMNYNNENTYVIDMQYDQYNNLISKSVYNKITGQTYLYTFKYEYHNGFWECIDNDVVVLNKVGDVMYPEGVVE
jgi:hypothetical protein